MELVLSCGERRWRADLSTPHDISIPLRFDAPQPQCFGAASAHSEIYASGDFLGDVSRGGSCNCATHTLTPHCNGTHTECVGHLTREPISIRDVAVTSLLIARLVTVQPQSSPNAPHADDRLITRAALQRSCGGAGLEAAQALVIRTLPNGIEKLSRDYDAGSPPAYLEPAAMQWLVECGIEHLLVDLPSVDRLADEGKLLAHRAFWEMPPGANHVADAKRPRATITELIYVPPEVKDGRYLLNLQIAPFVADAAPSRPVLYPLQQA